MDREEGVRVAPAETHDNPRIIPPMKFKTLPFAAAAGLGVYAGLPFAQAATISQSANLGAGNQWNQATYWGGNTVQAGNDYQTGTGFGASNYAFTVNGRTFDYTGEVRDAQDAGVNNTFGGDRLVLSAGTRLLSKAQSITGVTSTVNLLTQGGYIASAANSSGNRSFLAGSITIASGTDTALLLNAPGTFAWTVNSALSGAVDTTLYVTVGGSGNEVKNGTLNLNSNFDSFAGTLYLSTVANSKVLPGNPTSALFSIANSAPLAALNLATGSANFSFNLNNALSFRAVTVNGTVLNPGTYDFAALDTLAPGKFVNNSGTLTVIPEPSAVLLGGLAMLGGWRRRRTTRSGG
ncbi:MAG: hypothetical protein JWO82_226 [Akkermansiaceae bacterium]|nr:hypothetical protein [Akkermansiaceae bacterium]